MDCEGEALLGHWLPRALADLAVSLARSGEFQPQRRDFLLAWGLPHTAALDKADEEAADEEGREERIGKLADWIERMGEEE